MDGNSSSLKKDLQAIVRATVQEQLWAKAALSYLGKGAEQGIDWRLTLVTLNGLKGKKGDPNAAEAREAAMQGAWWFGSRLLQAGLDQANQWCQWCHDNKGESVADNPLHGIWTCPRWGVSEAGPATKASQGLVAQASEGPTFTPYFGSEAWCRKAGPGPSWKAGDLLSRLCPEVAWTKPLAPTHFGWERVTLWPQTVQAAATLPIPPFAGWAGGYR